MAAFSRFEDIEAWQMGRTLTNDVYALTRKTRFDQDRSLRHQLRRACVSITSNIAEGFERHSHADFARFLDAARGSSAEVRSQLYVALDQHYIDQVAFDQAYALSTRISSALAGLLRHLRP
jgi:four helix bundle protein